MQGYLFILFLEVSKNFDNVVAVIFERKIEIIEIKTAGILKKIGYY